MPYFVSFAVVNWIDLFIREKYFNVVVESLAYCISHKGLIVNAWCNMPSHIHLIIRSETNLLEDIVRDMKKITSKELIKIIKNSHEESRKKWLLWMFKKAGSQNKRNQTYQLWQQHNQPIELNNNQKIDQRLNYLHMNPVKAGFVEEPSNWKFSSAKNYVGKEGMLDIKLII